MSCGVWQFTDYEQWYGIPQVEAWKDDSNCTNHSAVGYTITISSCGFTNTPSIAPAPIDQHDDAQLSFLFDGFPASTAHSITMQDYANGTVHWKSS